MQWLLPYRKKNKISFIKYTPFFSSYKNIQVLCSNKRIESKINSCTKLACQQGCTMTSNNTNVKIVFSEDIFFLPGAQKKFMNKSGGKNAFHGDPGHIFLHFPKTAMRRGKMVADGRWQNNVYNYLFGKNIYIL